MASRGHRPSAASLASTLATLADAAKLHTDDPARMHDIVDRLAFRIHDTEELFQFCPVASGGGTIWGLICESPPILAGVLIRRLFVDRLGDEFELSERHHDALVFALDEFSENLGLLEVIGRCPSVRAEYSERAGGLRRAERALEQLRGLLLQGHAGRVDADCGCMGTTSGVYGARDGDAFFAESDLFLALLRLLLAPECHALPGACAAAGGESAAVLRRVCLAVADISSLLGAHPRVLSRAFAFLSSAAPLAFKPDHLLPGAEYSVLSHMLCTSESFNFMKDVLRACGSSRMQEASEVQAVRVAILGTGRVESGPTASQAGRALDTRLMLCWVLLVVFHLAEMCQRSSAEPQRFASQTMEGFRKHLMPCLRSSLNGSLAGAWPGLRHALGAIVSAGERPTPPEAVASSRRAFRSFAAAQFLPANNRLPAEQLEQLLDPFGSRRPTTAAIAAATLAARSAPRACSGAGADAAILPGATTLMSGSRPGQEAATMLPPLGRAVESAQARANDTMVQKAPFGETPRNQGLKFESFVKEHNIQRDDDAAAPGGFASSDPRLDRLPKPLPSGRAGGGAGAGGRRSGLARTRRPPQGTARGFFYNAGTSEYIGC